MSPKFSETALPTGELDDTLVVSTREIPEAPTFRPTAAEFSDSVAYIDKIARECHAYGIFKIVVPQERRPSYKHDLVQKFTVRVQKVQPVQCFKNSTHFFSSRDGEAFGFVNSAKAYSLGEHRRQAMETTRKELKAANAMTTEEIEAHFWEVLHSKRVFNAYYGNDVPGDIATDDSKWTIQQLPSSNRCCLRLLEDFPGVTSPMLYIGCLFGMFCWHVEDNWLSAASYNYEGAPKVW